MAELAIRPYGPEMRGVWDALVDGARNGTFLHRRGYVEYHADRFEDRSALVMDGGKAVAAFPASLDGDGIVSHGGLTFGGLLYGPKVKAATVRAALAALAAHYRGRGAASLTYRAVPHVFHRYPAEDDLHALFALGARLVRRDLSCAIPLARRIDYASRRRRGIRKAQRAGIEVRTGDFHAPFHALLAGVLRRHGAVPVHSPEELALLGERFEENIRLHGAFEGEALVAGTWVFRMGGVLHTQYLASSDRGREVGALDLLVDRLIATAPPGIDWLSMGASTEADGTVLNEGLMRQKEEFGARGIVLDRYRLDLR